MEEFASKGMGKVKAAEATLKGLKGVFKVLAEQHGEVTALLLRAKASSQVEKKRDLWVTIRQELLSHERAELEVVYPVLRRYEATQPIAQTHEVEAAELSSMINRLEAGQIGSSDWNDVFDRLVTTVKSHASEEEREFFPKAQHVIGEDVAKGLEPKFLAAKQRHMKQAA